MCERSVQQPIVRVRCTVNGKAMERDVQPRLMLVDFLRDELGLTGTKVSCGMQVCGSCTVLVDLLPVSSCSYLAADADGHAILTIEGLADGSHLHPVQEAFVGCSALQCGYCTPGYIMSVVALLADNPHPSQDEILHFLDGNICRCTGYKPIIAAVKVAAENMLQERQKT